MAIQIEVKIKKFSRIVAYTMGPTIMLGPIAFAIYISIFNSTGMSFWVYTLFFPALSLLFIYGMIDSISEVKINQNEITWKYLFLPKTCTMPINSLLKIKPYYDINGNRVAYKYVFNNGKSFGIVDYDMENSNLLFEYLNQYLNNRK